MSDVAERLAFVAGSLNRRLRPPADALTHIAISALASVLRAGAVRPGDLARIEGVAAPGMTRLLADLEQRGLVTREPDPGDGRSQLIRLSGTGEAAVIAARQARATGMAALLERVPDEDLEVVARALDVLERALLVTDAVPARVPAG